MTREWRNRQRPRQSLRRTRTRPPSSSIVSSLRKTEMPAQTPVFHQLDDEHMRLAVDEACAGVEANHGGPFGAVVVRDGKLIATGHNMVITTNDPTMHAEVTAIRNACSKLGTFDLSGCVLYTSCYPCPMCMGACLWARLDAIYYGATAEQAAAIGFDDKAFHDFLKDPKSDNSRKLEHLPTDDYLRPFEKWASKADKTQY